MFSLPKGSSIRSSSFASSMAQKNMPLCKVVVTIVDGGAEVGPLQSHVLRLGLVLDLGEKAWLMAKQHWRGV